jgi:hypothetical protein
MDTIENIVEAAQLGLSHWYHTREINLSKKLHLKSIDLAKEQFVKDIQLSKQTYLMDVFLNLEQHFQQLNAGKKAYFNFYSQIYLRYGWSTPNILNVIRFNI